MNAISNWFDTKFVPEWRSFWKMLSVQWNVICAAAVPAWLALPDDQKAAVLGAIGVNPGWIISAAFVVGILARLKSQGISAGDPERKDPS